MARKAPRLKRHFYGEGKPGVGYIPVIPPQPADDAVWDDYWWKWVKEGTPVQDGIDVVRVLHSARDVDAAFGEEL